MTTLIQAQPVTLPLAVHVPSLAAVDLLAAAQRSMAEAAAATTAQERYAAAHLAALRAAAAVLAERGRPNARRRRVRSVWVVLPEVAPEFSEWAAFFASGARKRAIAEVGIACVNEREADDLMRATDDFIARIASSLGLAHRSMPSVGLRHTG